MRKIKSLGQHFLKDEDAALNMVEALQIQSSEQQIVVEIGPGEGVLTKYLLQKKNFQLYVVELDKRLPAYLIKKFPDLKGRIIQADVLKVPFDDIFSENGQPLSFNIIGNFPYNISSQILFKILQHRDQVTQMVGMFQKEVAQRVAAKPNSKAYGILSVLIQLYYQVDYLFTIPPHSFDPPPKVQSASIRLQRITHLETQVNYDEFAKVVKKAFSQRRKKLRNALKGFHFEETQLPADLFDRRAEQLSVEEFIVLTNARR